MFTRIGAASINTTPGAMWSNSDKLIAVIEEARNAGVTILCTPELGISGYGSEDLHFSEEWVNLAWGYLEKIIPHTSKMFVTVGLPLRYGGVTYNVTAAIANGKLVGLVPKQHLANDGVHYEARWFKEWESGKVRTLIRGEHTVPIGDLMFSFGPIWLSIEICEDAWNGERPLNRHAKRGVDIVLNPSASHFAFGKHNVRMDLVRNSSRQFNVVYVYASLQGNEAGGIIYDGDCLIASGGEIIQSSKRFSFKQTQLITADVDLNANRTSRNKNFTFQPELDSSQGDIFIGDLVDIKCENQSITWHQTQPWEKLDSIKEEEFTRAAALGLFDYIRKSKSKGATVSLSGGADSSCVLVLMRQMVELGLEELGWAEFRKHFDYIKGIATLGEEPSASQVMSVLMTTMYQSTKNSSKETEESAKELAGELGATHYNWSIQWMFDGCVEFAAKLLARQISWEDKTLDLPLQNLQARLRAPFIWLFANILGKLLLVTSNRSESGVGYCTMDGDTSGGLNPIGGVDKQFIKSYLRHMQINGRYGAAPITALRYVNGLEASAELRPLENKQTDEADLMPYEVLDAIEGYFVRDMLLPVSAFHRVRMKFGNKYEAEALRGWVVKYFQLFCQNQWKRVRFAVTFHMDNRLLCPKTWLRFPVLSDGFSQEIAELKALDLSKKAA